MHAFFASPFDSDWFEEYFSQKIWTAIASQIDADSPGRARSIHARIFCYTLLVMMDLAGLAD
jgi:hypothetical protein